MNDQNAGTPSSRNELHSAAFNDPNAALWASITPPATPSLTTEMSRRMAALSPDLLAHRLRLAFPRIFLSHAMAFYAILGGAMAIGASVGLLGFAAAGALELESSASAAAPPSVIGSEPAGAQRVSRETPSLRPAVAGLAGDAVAGLAASTAATASERNLGTLTATSRTVADDVASNVVDGSDVSDGVDEPAPPPRAKRQHSFKKKAKRVHASKKRSSSRRDTKPRVRNEKARALARALGS